MNALGLQLGRIYKHKRCTHHVTDNFSSNILNDHLSPKNSIKNESIYEIQSIASELSATTTNPPSTIAIADLDTDEMPIRFRLCFIFRDANKSIVFSVSCLERYQLVITQTASINSETTYLITNDDKHTLHSPLSMKLIEAIANHCFYVSYRWLINYIKYDRIVDKGAYEIEGDDTGYHSQDGPKRSRSIDKRQSLFEYICFMIKCTENNEIKMANDRLQDLITTGGERIITYVTQGAYLINLKLLFSVINYMYQNEVIIMINVVH
ncbi:unnamed protein product [Rotaria sp. Silwood2]|nr:unnamed protein product [Rotaria sp. Silwood2]CAF4313313.1 unnamed protein product [Rotaria sp. Silwood2]